MSGKRKLSDFWGPQAPANPAAAHAPSSHVNAAAAAPSTFVNSAAVPMQATNQPPDGAAATAATPFTIAPCALTHTHTHARTHTQTLTHESTSLFG